MPDGPIVLFGGSFDPPTLAHTQLPPIAAEILGASRLVYIPAAISPHKTDRPPTNASDRVAMLRLAIAHCPEAELDLRELDRPAPSYAIDTLTQWRTDVGPDVPIRLLIGTDQAHAFHRWHRWQDILALASPAVLVRSDDDVEDVLRDIAAGQGHDAISQWRSWMVNTPRMPQQSTLTRSLAKLGESLDQCVSHDVGTYIREHALYRGSIAT